MRIMWIRGEREATGTKGKHGGPSVKQDVVKVLVPRVKVLSSRKGRLGS